MCARSLFRASGLLVCSSANQLTHLQLATGLQSAGKLALTRDGCRQVGRKAVAAAAAGTHVGDTRRQSHTAGACKGWRSGGPARLAAGGGSHRWWAGRQWAAQHARTPARGAARTLPRRQAVAWGGSSPAKPAAGQRTAQRRGALACPAGLGTPAVTGEPAAAAATAVLLLLPFCDCCCCQLIADKTPGLATWFSHQASCCGACDTHRAGCLIHRRVLLAWWLHMAAAAADIAPGCSAACASHCTASPADRCRGVCQ